MLDFKQNTSKCLIFKLINNGDVKSMKIGYFVMKIYKKNYNIIKDFILKNVKSLYLYIE